jgi:LPS export ABC transporter protein LptC
MEVGKVRFVCLERAAATFTMGLVCVVALVLAVGCSREEGGEIAQERDRPIPDQVISEFRITETSMGKKDWSMEAEEAYIYDRRDVLEARVVEVTFFDPDGSIRSVLKADYGKLNRATDDMEARGNVVVTGSDGVVLETESLMWQSKTRHIVSDDSVKVIRNEDILTGWGFSGDPDLGSFSILRNMRATIRPKQQATEDGRRHGTGTTN